MKSENKKTGNITIGVTASGFPFSLFKQWEKDCKERFNNLRWVKLWSDHQDARNFQFLKEKIVQLENRIDQLENTDDSEKKDEPKTFGSGDD